MSLKLITPPTFEPISLDEAKEQCRVDGIEDDLLLAILITAARESAEHETGRALATQTRELVLDAFPEAFTLRGSPIQSVESVKYLDSDGIQRTLDPQDYALDNDSEPGYLTIAYGRAWPASYPVPNAVRVRYVCGYASAAAVPSAIKSWLLLAVGTMFAQRETIAVGQPAALPDRFWHRLLDPYRMYE